MSTLTYTSVHVSIYHATFFMVIKKNNHKYTNIIIWFVHTITYISKYICLYLSIYKYILFSSVPTQQRKRSSLIFHFSCNDCLGSPSFCVALTHAWLQSQIPHGVSTQTWRDTYLHHIQIQHWRSMHLSRRAARARAPNPPLTNTRFGPRKLETYPILVFIQVFGMPTQCMSIHLSPLYHGYVTSEISAGVHRKKRGEVISRTCRGGSEDSGLEQTWKSTNVDKSWAHPPTHLTWE